MQMNIGQTFQHNTKKQIKVNEQYYFDVLYFTVTVVSSTMSICHILR